MEAYSPHTHTDTHTHTHTHTHTQGSDPELRERPIQYIYSRMCSLSKPQLLAPLLWFPVCVRLAVYLPPQHTHTHTHTHLRALSKWVLAGHIFYTRLSCSDVQVLRCKCISQPEKEKKEKPYSPAPLLKKQKEELLTSTLDVLNKERCNCFSACVCIRSAQRKNKGHICLIE